MNTYGRWNKKDEERNYINETIKRILPEVESYGVLSTSVITIYNDAITDAVRDGMCVYNIYESLVVWLESIALREVKFKIQRVSSVVKTNKDDRGVLNQELAIKELKVMAKEYAVSFDETELNMFSISLYLRAVGMVQQSENILTVITNSLVKRLYVDYFKDQFCKNISSCISSGLLTAEFEEFSYQEKTKRGPRNKHYSEVLRVVNLTLEQYPDVSTYSLSNKLSVHLSSHRDAPSIQTLRRWVQSIRDENHQIPQEPYTKRFKLVL